MSDADLEATLAWAAREAAIRTAAVELAMLVHGWADDELVAGYVVDIRRKLNRKEGST